MRQLIVAVTSGALLASTIQPAQANAYNIGMQWCQMVRSGMNASEAWKIIVNDYASGQGTMLDRGDPYAPWSPTRTWSGAIGAGVGAGIAGGLMAAFNLNRMRSDIISTTDANCPEFGLYIGRNRPKSSVPTATGSNSVPGNAASLTPKDLWCIPWAEKCNDPGSDKATNQNKPCNKTIEKYECSYQKYLAANPSISNWAKQNPAMAKKEAVRLGAIDAETIEVPSAKQSSSKAENSVTKKEIEHKCLKAADYKGCMEYNSQK